MDRFSYRQYRPGDSDAINQLYFEVTGRERSIDEYLWQWHQSPSGPGDIWLIHDNKNNGKLIGHHGVMPIRFTLGDKDLLFGKTENTMVLPRYRSAILYPRYELRFQRQYEARYHALFSTMGPDAAIRLRRAMGYSFPVRWNSFLVGNSWLSEFYCLNIMLSRLLKKSQEGALKEEAELKKRIRGAGFLTSNVAKDHPFFSSFWPDARLNHGIAPRRDRADLKWRFWCNPYTDYFTYVLDSEVFSGYVIFSLRGRTAKLEDYAVLDPSEHCYAVLFKKVCSKLAAAGVRAFAAVTTDDAVLTAANRWFGSHEAFCYRVLKKLRPPKDRMMPRYISSEKKTRELGVYNWAVTGLIFEGR